MFESFLQNYVPVTYKIEKPNLLKEVFMIEVTEAAQKQLADFFIDREVKPVRVFLNESG
jgi:hypothetical protein